MIENARHSQQQLEALERDLDLPLQWELADGEAEALRRRIEAERNRGAQSRFMQMMKPGAARG